MISIKKEQLVHEFLDAGLSGNEIASYLKIPHKTVYTIRDARELAASLPAERRKAIRILLQADLPVGAIETTLKIPRAEILAVRRVQYMQRRRVDEHETHQCPTCGAIMFPEGEPPESRLERREPPPAIARCDSAAELFRIVEEVSHLGEIRIVRNPVFHGLANKARRTIEKMTGDQYGQAKAG